MKTLIRVILLVTVHSLVFSLLKLPYINLIGLYFPVIIYLIDIILVLILFRPAIYLLLYSAGFIMISAGMVYLLGFPNTAIMLGDLTYLLVAAYIIMSIKELFL